MGRKQDDFINGMEAGARPFEKKFEQLSENTRKIGEAVNTRLDGIGEVIDILADDLSDMQKKELYHLNTPYDLKEDLDDDEKEIVASLLLVLSEFTENNEYQKKFIRAVNAYIGVKAPQAGFDIACIENIENIKSQKIIMQTIMEYLYLSTEDFSFLEEMEEVFDHFSVNKKGIREIESYIETIYRATGKDGIAEKYGFVPKEEAMYSIQMEQEKKYEFPCYDGSDISEACADKINFRYHYVVLKEYLAYCEEGQIHCVHKQTGREIIISIDIEYVPSINNKNLCGYDKYIYLIHSSGIYMADIEIDSGMKKINEVRGDSGHPLEATQFYSQCNERYYVYKYVNDYDYLYCVDLKTMTINRMDISGAFKLVHNTVYFIKEGFILCKYDLETKMMKDSIAFIADMVSQKACSGFLGLDGYGAHSRTYQFGKYIISILESDADKLVYGCFDMQNESFQMNCIPNEDNVAINAYVAYNYIYCLSEDSDIVRYDILTKRMEKIVHAENAVYYYREGFMKKRKVLSVGNTRINIVGNWLYYRDSDDEECIHKINIEEKTEMVIDL